MMSISALLAELYHTVAYPAPKDPSNVIATALHQAKDNKDRERAKKARHIIRNLRRQLRRGVYENFHLHHIRKNELTVEAYDAFVKELKVPTLVSDFVPGSTAYLVARTLQIAERGFDVDAFQCDDSSILDIDLRAAGVLALVLAMEFNPSECNRPF